MPRKSISSSEPTWTSPAWPNVAAVEERVVEPGLRPQRLERPEQVVGGGLPRLCAGEQCRLGVHQVGLRVDAGGRARGPGPARARRRSPAGWGPTAGTSMRSRRGPGHARSGRRPGRRRAASRWSSRTRPRPAGARRRPRRPSAPRPSSARSESVNAAIFFDAAFSSDSTTVGASPVICLRRAAYARAESWSVAMTRPPASGTCRRTSVSRVSAAASTERIQSPVGSSAVRSACALRSWVSGSPSRAAISSPARVRHCISPEYARNSTGRTTRSASACS